MTAITVALDFGASGLRVILTPEVFKPQLLLMEPEVSKVTTQGLENYTSKRLGSTDPTRCAWVEYNNQFYAVGHLAKRFRANLQLKKRKFELALPKVLAVIGIISQIHNLANGTIINLGIVLPWGEYSDKEYFEKLLQTALSDFKFCQVEKSFLLEQFVCIPEGGGVLFQGRNPGTSFADLSLIVLMLGFRDISMLFVDHGEMSKGITEANGFSVFLNSVAEKIAFFDYPKLAALICKAGKNINPKALLPLLDNVGQDYTDYELAKIRQAIADSRKEYWLILEEWLKLQIPSGVDELIVAGGTANYLKSELNPFLKSRTTKVLWCQQLERRIQSSFSKQIKANSLEYRLADVYGLFFYLCGRTAKVGVTNE